MVDESVGVGRHSSLARAITGLPLAVLFESRDRCIDLLGQPLFKDRRKNPPDEVGLVAGIVPYGGDAGRKGKAVDFEAVTEDALVRDMQRLGGTRYQ